MVDFFDSQRNSRSVISIIAGADIYNLICPSVRGIFAPVGGAAGGDGRH